MSTTHAMTIGETHPVFSIPPKAIDIPSKIAFEVNIRLIHFSEPQKSI